MHDLSNKAGGGVRLWRYLSDMLMSLGFIWQTVMFHSFMYSNSNSYVYFVSCAVLNIQLRMIINTVRQELAD